MTKLEALADELPADTRELVLDMRDVFSMDAFGVMAIDNRQRALARTNVRLAVLHLNEHCRSVVEQSGLDLPAFGADDGGVPKILASN